jgi:hypothetical protein
MENMENIMIFREILSGKCSGKFPTMARTNTMSFSLFVLKLECSGKTWFCLLHPLSEAPVTSSERHQERTRKFQGSHHDPGCSGTFRFLSWCLSEGVVGA